MRIKGPAQSAQSAIDKQSEIASLKQKPVVQTSSYGNWQQNMTNSVKCLGVVQLMLKAISPLLFPSLT